MDYTKVELKEALQAISSMLGKCEKVEPKLKPGTSQSTLLSRLQGRKIAYAIIFDKHKYRGSFLVDVFSIKRWGEMKYTWKCPSCALAKVHVSRSSNPYLVGHEIYSDHKWRSPHCLRPILEIHEGDAETFIESKSFQDEVERIKRLGGFVEISTNTVTLYPGIMPASTIHSIANLLVRLDVNHLLKIVVSKKDRP